MRTLVSLLVATLLGFGSTAFAAEPTTREARMAEAMKDYRAQKAGGVAPVKAVPAHLTHAVATKHKAKKHAKANKAKRASAKPASAASK